MLPLILLPLLLTQTPPSVVLVLADDLGHGDLGCYGHPTIRTPHLDRMAVDGLRLTEFYAAPACSQARAALLTGRYAPRSGIYRVLGPDEPGGIPASETTLAEALKTRGYATAAIGKWHLGSQLPSHLPTANGFDEYLGLLYSNDMIPPWVETSRPLRLHEGPAPIDAPVDQTTLTQRYIDRAIDFIRRSRDRPFFLYLAHSMPHVPLHASPPFAGRSRAGLYGDVIEEIDAGMGRILAALREVGIDDSTLIIFTSDNGPWQDMPPRMFRGGTVKPWHAGSTGGLRGAKGTTHEGGVRVPCILRWPGRIPAGRASPGIASLMDLHATALSLAGVSPPAGLLDGLDLSPLLLGTGPSPRQELIHFAGKVPEAIRHGRWKLRAERRPRSPDEPSLLVELFDLDTDPAERFDLSEREPAIRARLLARLDEARREIPCGRALDGWRRF